MKRDPDLMVSISNANDFFPQHFSGHFLRAHQSSDLSDYFGDYFSCLVRGFTEKSIESIERLNNWPGLDLIQFWPPNAYWKGCI